MSQLRLPNGRAVRPGAEELGSGLRSTVRTIADTDVACMKIYFEGHAPPRERIQALCALPPGDWTGDRADHLHVAWPRAPLLDETGATRAVVLPRVSGVTVHRLLEPERRAEFLAEPTWRTNLAIAERIARLVQMLHGVSVIVGDLTPNNILVNRAGYVTLIDCDTVQFTDPGTGAFFPSSEFTPEYASPEMLTGQPTKTSAEHDLFALAIMVCELLLEGQHPFEGVPAAGGEDSIEANIRRQNNWVTHPERMVQRPDLIPPTILPPGVLALLRQCFAAGHGDPALRPAAGQWAAVLQQAAFELMGCRYNPMHAYPRSLPSCVWCYRAASGLAEHFPVPAGWTPPVPVTRPAPAQPTRPVRTVPPVRTAPTRPTRPPARAPGRPAASPYPPPPRRPVGPPPQQRPGPQRAAPPRGPQPAKPPVGKPAKSGGGTGAGVAIAVVVAIILLLVLLGSLA